MADNEIGSSDGSVYEDGLSHSMDIPVPKPEGARQPLVVTVHPKPLKETPDAAAGPGQDKDFDPTQIDPYAQTNAQAVLSRQQTSKDILSSQIPAILKPEERKSMSEEFENAPTLGEKVKVAAGVVGQTAMDILPAAKTLAGAKMLGVFGGAGARWSMGELKNLMEAQAMKNNLRRPDHEIFQRTGWYVDEDGLWKTVMPTHNAKLNKKMFAYEDPTPMEGNGWETAGESAGGYTPIINGLKKLSDIYTNPELFKLYPELKDINIEYAPKSLPGTGAYNEATNTISFAPRARNLNDFMDTLHHEIQHAIQGIENWPRGSSSLMMTRHPDYLAYQSKRDFVHESEDLIADKIVEKTGLPKFSVAEGGKAVGNLHSAYSMLHFMKQYGPENIERSMAGEKVPELDFLEGYKDAVELYKKFPELHSAAKSYKIALDYIKNNKVDPYYLYLKTRGEVEARNAARYGAKSVREKASLQKQGLSPRDLAKDIVPENERVNSVTGPEVVGEPSNQEGKPYKNYIPRNLDEGNHNGLKNNPEFYLPYIRRSISEEKSVKDMAKELKVNELDLQSVVNRFSKEIAKPEKVTEAAIKLGNRIWTGQMHFDAFNKALEAGDASLKDLYTKAEQGFYTNNGRFISREEAANLGKKPKKSDEPFMSEEPPNNVTTFRRAANDNNREHPVFYENPETPHNNFIKQPTITPESIDKSLKNFGEKQELLNNEWDALNYKFELHKWMREISGKDNEEFLLNQRMRQIKYDAKQHSDELYPHEKQAINWIKERLTELRKKK